MKNITLEKLYKYLEERFAIHDRQFERVFDQMGELEDRLQSSINQVQVTVDGLAKQYNKLSDERIILHGRVYNLEDWTKKAADKIDLPFRQ